MSNAHRTDRSYEYRTDELIAAGTFDEPQVKADVLAALRKDAPDWAPYKVRWEDAELRSMYFESNGRIFYIVAIPKVAAAPAPLTYET